MRSDETWEHPYFLRLRGISYLICLFIYNLWQTLMKDVYLITSREYKFIFTELHTVLSDGKII